MTVRRLIHVMIASFCLRCRSPPYQRKPNRFSHLKMRIQQRLTRQPPFWLAPTGRDLARAPRDGGSYKLDGWKMALDETGQPHFSLPQSQPAIANPEDRYWSKDFLLGVEAIGSEKLDVCLRPGHQ